MQLIKTNFSNIIQQLHLKNQAQDNLELTSKILNIKTQIIQKGDEAALAFTRQFDQVTATNFTFKVTDTEIKEAYTTISKDFILAVKKAQQNLTKYYQRQLPKSWFCSAGPGKKYGLKYTPIDRVGLYVPGGRAPYPSTVYMNAIPALVAGVKNITLVSPPNPQGKLPASILVAADLCGIKNIYKIGGAQAIFSLAYGTTSIPKVDKIVGPGNIYVTLAKQLVYGTVDIDKPAGPSEALIYLEDEKYIPFSVHDFLAQLEHDPNASAIVISSNETLLLNLQKEVQKILPTCQRAAIIQTSLNNSYCFLAQNPQHALELINNIASEHLVLLTDNANQLVNQITNAGAIFIGPYTPITLGDYYAGPNHVLPTSGAAKFASPLGVMDFLKYSSLLEYNQAALAKAQKHITTLTQAEGFDAHQKALQIRLT